MLVKYNKLLEKIDDAFKLDYLMVNNKDIVKNSFKDLLKEYHMTNNMFALQDFFHLACDKEIYVLIDLAVELGVDVDAINPHSFFGYDKYTALERAIFENASNKLIKKLIVIGCKTKEYYEYEIDIRRYYAQIENITYLMTLIEKKDNGQILW